MDDENGTWYVTKCLNVYIVKGYSIDGERMLHELVEGDGDDVERSTSQQQQHEDIGIDISSPSHPDEQSISYENSLPYQSFNNGFVSQSASSSKRDYHNQLSHGSEKSDSDSYYDCNSSFSGRANMLTCDYMPDHYPRSEPSSLPGKGYVIFQHITMCVVGLLHIANRCLISTYMLSLQEVSWLTS